MLKNTKTERYKTDTQYWLLSLSSLSQSTQSVVIGQLTHAWANNANNKEVAVLNKFLHAKLAAQCRGSPKSSSILWEAWMSEQHLVHPVDVFTEKGLSSINYLVVEICQTEPKWWIGWLVGPPAWLKQHHWR